MKFSIATLAPFKLSSYPFNTLESSVTPASTTTGPFSILLFTITATVSPGDVVIAGPPVVDFFRFSLAVFKAVNASSTCFCVASGSAKTPLAAVKALSKTVHVAGV